MFYHCFRYDLIENGESIEVSAMQNIGTMYMC